MSEPVASNFPSSLDTSVTLGGDAVNFASFTLDAGIDTSVTTVSVTEDITGINVPCYILCDSELIWATAKSSGNFTNCDRGAGGTTAASHLNGANVYVTYAANMFNQLKRAIIAIETELGISPSGAFADVKSRFDSNISSNGWTSSSDTWSYSSVDSPTGILSVNADYTGVLFNGMRIKYNQDQALTAYFPFNTDSTSTVGSFTSTDTAVTYTAGKFSNAATFNGTTSKIVLTDNILLKPTTFTIRCWIKTSQTGSYQIIYSAFGTSTNYSGIIFRINTDNHVELFIGKNSGTSLNADFTRISGNTNICDNTFHKIEVTFSNNYVQLYTDGSLDGSAYSYPPVYNGTIVTSIGELNGSYYFNGQIDDLVLINGYALSEETIREQYRAGTAQGAGNITVTKKAIVTDVSAWTGSETLITCYHGTDHMLANAAISNPYYSGMKVPYGFNSNPNKWSLQYYSALDVAFTSGTDAMQNITGASIDCPIGLWNPFGNVYLLGTRGSAGTIQPALCLSTSPTAISDSSLLQTSGEYGTAFGVSMTVGQGVVIDFKEKTTLYLNISSILFPVDVIQAVGTRNPIVIKLTNAYL